MHIMNLPLQEASNELYFYFKDHSEKITKISQPEENS
jgi:hypothetical protein